MAAALEETQISYEDLAALEQDFDDVEVEILRQQIALQTPLYTKRAELTSQIPNFWPLVLEQAPPDVDQYIQPSDSALLLSSLTNLSITHFDSEDPRSVSIRWEFSPNEHFEDSVLEKKFWYRKNEDGWSGLVSEPVKVSWKSKEKDLTGGLLDMVIECWEEEKAAGIKKSLQKKEFSAKQKQLNKKIETTGMGGASFFAWFGYIGQRVTAEESAKATKLENEKKAKRQNGEKVVEEEKKDDEENEDEGDDLYLLEIFPDGDDLAVAITEDLWPSAIKYFTQAQETDALSDLEFESGSDDEDAPELVDIDEEEEDDDAPPSKRVKSS